MKAVVVWRAGALAAVLTIAGAMSPIQAGADESDVSLSLTQHVARAPATVQLRVRVAPHSDNRVLRVSLDSGAYYRSSDVALDGSGAAPAHLVRWPGVPAGSYTIVVELVRSNGQRRVVRGGPVQVIGF